MKIAKIAEAEFQALFFNRITGNGPSLPSKPKHSHIIFKVLQSPQARRDRRRHPTPKAPATAAQTSVEGSGMAESCQPMSCRPAKSRVVKNFREPTVKDGSMAAAWGVNVPTSVLIVPSAR